MDSKITFADMSNPFQRIIRFVLTDFKPNANNEQIPEDEADNIIRSALFFAGKNISHAERSERSCVCRAYRRRYIRAQRRGQDYCRGAHLGNRKQRCYRLDCRTLCGERADYRIVGIDV